MSDIAQFIRSDSTKVRPEYDFEKIDQSSICDEIIDHCNLSVTSAKVLAAAVIVFSALNLIFVAIGAVAYLGPVGILTYRLQLLKVLKAVVITTGLGAVPLIALNEGITDLIRIKDHYLGQIALAENHKVTLLANNRLG